MSWSLIGRRAQLCAFGVFLFASSGCVDASAPSFNHSLADCGEASSLTWAEGEVNGGGDEILDVACVNESRLRHGPAVRIANGRARSFASFVEGQQEGPAVVFSADGSIQAVTITDSGVPRRAYFWNPSGRIEHLAELHEMGNSSTHTYWHPNGNMQRRFSTKLTRQQDPTSATLHGEFAAWHSTGSLLASGTYEEGLKVGRWTCKKGPAADEVSAIMPQGSNGRASTGDAIDECVAAYVTESSGEYSIADSAQP